VEVLFNHLKKRRAPMNTTTYGLDIAKQVFQLYWVELETGQIFNRRFSRDQLIRFLATRAAGRVALEACGGAHWWARKLTQLGHEAVLIHPSYVRPFVQTNKTDAADARAICMAAQQPGMRTVAAKTEGQQAILGLHRIRSGLIDSRTRDINQIRGLLSEYGLSFKRGRRSVMKELQVRIAEIEMSVPGLIWQSIQRQISRLGELENDIAKLDLAISQWMKGSPEALRVEAMAGVGPLTATALVAVMGDPGTFRSGRAFAASLGLVPRQTGTGGKVRLGGISKRGDPYLRKLLVHGARVVVTCAKERPQWIEELLKRRPVNVVIVALANKMARIAWALLAHGKQYEHDHVSVRPA